MGDRSNLVIAVFNGQKSGTKNTVDYAIKKGITHKMKKGRCCFVDDKYVVTCEDDNIQNDKEFILNIQKAMLVTLFESKKINHFQYEYAIELLEKNFRKK